MPFVNKDSFPAQKLIVVAVVLKWEHSKNGLGMFGDVDPVFDVWGYLTNPYPKSFELIVARKLCLHIAALPTAEHQQQPSITPPHLAFSKFRTV